jgi:calcineurin-like phosphoesterase family protein
MYTLKIEDPDKLFFTSDTHLGHFNICKYCHRPFQSKSEMDQTLIANWNSVVPEDGIVVHCGDFMLPHDLNIKEYMRYLNKLNGRVLLLRGNHDIIELLTSNEKLISVQDKAMIEVDSIKIYAEHYPCAAFNGDYHVYGHVHTLSDGICYGMDADALKAMKRVTYDVGVDQNNYTPVSYWQLCDIIRKRLNEGVPAKKG